MIHSSGFFNTPEPVFQASITGLEVISNPEQGFCIILKGNRNDRLVAYKTLKEEFRDNPVYQRMLRREYEIGVSLKHPGICEVLAWVHIPGYGDSIEMEYIDGTSLDQWLLQHSGNTAKHRKILVDICEALTYIHRKQVIHRDLKPENIIITANGDYPKIIDFGLSDTDYILTGKDPAGTIEYAAPEVIEGASAEPRSDIYSLGVIMQKMGPAFSRISRRCSSADIRRRYPTAEAVSHSLQRPSHSYLLLLIIPVLLTAAIFYAIKRNDPVQKLFLEAAEQVVEAAKPS